MKKIELKDTQWEDLDDLLFEIEDKFNFHFEDYELENIADFDELVSLIMRKIDGEDDTLCTSLLAFYKIKSVIREAGSYDPAKLCPSTKLEDIFPKKNRRRLVNTFNRGIGAKLEILEPNRIILNFCCIVLILSIVGLFFYFKLAIVGIAISILGIKSIYVFTQKLKYDTVKGMIKGNLCVNYLAFRQNRTTINRKELRKLFYDFFSTNLALNQDELRRVSFR